MGSRYIAGQSCVTSYLLRNSYPTDFLPILPKGMWCVVVDTPVNQIIVFFGLRRISIAGLTWAPMLVCSVPGLVSYGGSSTTRGLCIGMLPVGSYNVACFGYLTWGSGSYNHKVGYPKIWVWYEPTDMLMGALSGNLQNSSQNVCPRSASWAIKCCNATWVTNGL